MNSIVETVDVIREQMNAATMVTLARTFEVNDHTGTGKFEFDDFETILKKCAIFVKLQELKRLHRRFGNEHYSEFLSVLRGELSPRREAMIQRVWDAITGESAVLTLDVLWGRFTPDMHPKVQSTAMSVETVVAQMQSTLARMGIVEGSLVTFEQFRDIYANASSADFYDDDLFVRILEGVWGVPEANATPVPAGFLQKVRAVLWEKVRQKTATGSSEKDTLRLALRSLDLENCGSVGLHQFRMGLEKFGLALQLNVSELLFRAHAEGEWLDIAAFAEAVCGDGLTIPDGSLQTPLAEEVAF